MYVKVGGRESNLEEENEKEEDDDRKEGSKVGGRE